MTSMDILFSVFRGDLSVLVSVPTIHLPLLPAWPVCLGKGPSGSCHRRGDGVQGDDPGSGSWGCIPLPPSWSPWLLFGPWKSPGVRYQEHLDSDLLRGGVNGRVKLPEIGSAFLVSPVAG